MDKLVRKNIRMSADVAKFYADKSESIGVSQSALMAMALNDYIKQDKAINAMSDIQKYVKING